MPKRLFTGPMCGLFALLALAGCTAVKPVSLSNDRAAPTSFAHDDFDRVVRRFVNDAGRVNYGALKRDSRALDRYYQMVTQYSPDSDPQLFPTEASKLAYWLNAYNAAVIKIVVTHYPISGVGDVTGVFPLSLLGGKVGFFVLQRPIFGGASMSLYGVENSVVRQRFMEPRVHFALNCASRGCPRLPLHAFTAAGLDAELEREAQRFFAESRNLRIDHQAKTVSLSSILEWYKDDFLTWYTRKFPGEDATLLKYAALYAPAETAAELRRAADYGIQFIPYDWRLNDQRGGR